MIKFNNKLSRKIQLLTTMLNSVQVPFIWWEKPSMDRIRNY